MAMNAIAEICAIPSDIKRHNLSLRQAIRRSGYRQSRAQLGEDDLASFLVDQTDLVESWVTFSVDKRTRGGWPSVSRTACGWSSSRSLRTATGECADSITCRTPARRSSSKNSTPR